MTHAAYLAATHGDPILMHGARVYVRSHDRHGLMHVASIAPLDARRRRPLGMWHHFTTTGVRTGIVESRLGHVLSLLDVSLEDVVLATVAATD
jgi:hypothetical protein